MGRPPLSAIVLAAGDGTRMRSSRPKALHVLCGKAMVVYVLDALADAAVDRTVVVVGVGAERVTKKLQEDGPDLVIEFVEQRFARGTGDAASVGLTAFDDDADLDGPSDDAHVIVLPGNMPLLRPATLRALADEHVAVGAAATILTTDLDDPTGHARVVRGKADRVTRVVEHADADPDELARREVATGIFCFRRSLLSPALRRIDPRNARGVYELSDAIVCSPRPVWCTPSPSATHRGAGGRRLRPAGAPKRSCGVARTSVGSKAVSRSSISRRRTRHHGRPRRRVTLFPALSWAHHRRGCEIG
jgi:bifunctional UDP-N-acetylglucosamine pyrophosphorylase/glucosamine-1-phosphate N-acetyltransferase